MSLSKSKCKSKFKQLFKNFKVRCSIANDFKKLKIPILISLQYLMLFIKLQRLLSYGNAHLGVEK